MTTEEKAKAYDKAVEQIKTLLGEKGTVIGRYWLEKFFPEFAESEDERIRKWIKKELESKYVVDNIVNNMMADKAFAYLEKQKDAIGAARQQGYEERLEDGIEMNMAEQMCESKEWADELGAEIDRISKRYPEVSFAKLSRVAVHFVRWQKEQKPAEIDEYEIIKKHITEDALSDEVNKRLKECGWYVTYDKPAEWSDNFEENIRELLHNKLTWHSEDGTMSSTVLIDDKTLKDIISGIWFYVGKEALKYPSKETNVTEWSEEDRKHLDWIIEHLRQGCGLYDALIYWLEQLPKRFNLQPKQEWSEEDKTFFEDVLWCVLLAKHYAPKYVCDTDTYTSAEKWLKSLPKRLKSLRPQPHWKPSEEQMEALYDVLHPCDPVDKEKLESLYNDLKVL